MAPTGLSWRARPGRSPEPPAERTARTSSRRSCSLILLSVVWLLARSSSPSEDPGWAAALLLAPPWIAFAPFVRCLFRTRDCVAAAAGTIRETLAATLAETRGELASVGKVSPSELRSLALALEGILAATVAVLLLRAVARLSPRARRLAALLADYDGAAEGQAGGRQN